MITLTMSLNYTAMKCTRSGCLVNMPRNPKFVTYCEHCSLTHWNQCLCSWKGSERVFARTLYNYFLPQFRPTSRADLEVHNFAQSNPYSNSKSQAFYDASVTIHSYNVNTQGKLMVFLEYDGSLSIESAVNPFDADDLEEQCSNSIDSMISMFSCRSMRPLKFGSVRPMLFQLKSFLTEFDQC